MDIRESFLEPRYGRSTLADLSPAVLDVLRVPGACDVLGLGLDGVNRVCILLVDGLGAALLDRYAEAAPFLHSLSRRSLTAGFPSTTATSLTSVGTGLPPGEHGVVGYLLATPGFDRLMNPLAWRLHGPGDHVDLLEELPPEDFQPTGTVFERAARDGVEVTRIGPRYQRDSGLTRAALRGGEFEPAVSLGDTAAGAAQALRAGTRSLAYVYHGDLDVTGHVRGPHSDAWALELANVDRLAAAIAERLPADGALMVTADHGMVEVTDRVDLDTREDLLDGVRLVGGEPRARHVYTRPGAHDDVLASWAESLGPDYLVVPSSEAIGRGWFGPVEPFAAERIGDVIAIARAAGALVRRGTEPLQSRLIGHHGSLTPDEMEIPLLVSRG